MLEFRILSLSVPCGIVPPHPPTAPPPALLIQPTNAADKLALTLDCNEAIARTDWTDGRTSQ